MKKKEILSVIDSLEKINDIVAKNQKSNISVETETLVDCQDAAIEIGNEIERIRQRGEEIVRLLEAYCENLYQMNCIREDANQCRKLTKKIQRQLLQIRNKVKYDLPEDKKQVVFLPYKASMWDSLESIWKAADADPNCEAYVIPIPYYDRNADGSFGTEHYEGDEYPDYVPVTHYNDYDFEECQPDVIFIHNPYDQYNNVTSVHPFFYSKNLKQFTDLLVYVPYYSTSGGMSAAQSRCPAYYYADYIVIQAEKYRKFFDADLPDEKFLPLGSPKFDKVVNMCKNPPEPPEEWKERMAGKKVYFYNTSIAGMLGNTPAFLKKLEYVFRCFANREDTCLLWRPHPLLESTFDSMRSEYRSVYDALKNYFMVSGIGIYDDTPDMISTIALCDAYIGDAGSSVTSLFGLVGKPVFILNNYIDNEPEEDDWKGEIEKGFPKYGSDDWKITQGNKLYYAPNHDYKYRYYCDLSDYAYGNYYLKSFYIHGKTYVCPHFAQEILVISDGGIKKRIALKRCIEHKSAFYGAINCDNYLFLLPDNYPAIVCYDMETDEISYFDRHVDVIHGIVKGEKRLGGYCTQNGYVFISSVIDNRVLAIHAKSGVEQVLTIDSDKLYGCRILSTDGVDLWFLPYKGYDIIRWNPENGKVHEYTAYVDGLECRYQNWGYECEICPFHEPAFFHDYVYLPPLWGNMYVTLNKTTGEIKEWKPPFEQKDSCKNGYYRTRSTAQFIRSVENTEGREYLMFSFYDRKLYKVDLENEEYQEIKIEFQTEELQAHEPGFMEISEWLQYACQENAFNSLPDFLNGKITGKQFDKDREICAYGQIAANNDGTCGAKVYDFVCDRLLGQ